MADVAGHWPALGPLRIISSHRAPSLKRNDMGRGALHIVSASLSKLRVLVTDSLEGSAFHSQGGRFASVACCTKESVSAQGSRAVRRVGCGRGAHPQPPAPSHMRRTPEMMTTPEDRPFDPQGWELYTFRSGKQVWCNSENQLREGKSTVKRSFSRSHYAWCWWDTAGERRQLECPLKRIEAVRPSPKNEAGQERGGGLHAIPSSKAGVAASAAAGRTPATVAASVVPGRVAASVAPAIAPASVSKAVAAPHEPMPQLSVQAPCTPQARVAVRPVCVPPRRIPPCVPSPRPAKVAPTTADSLANLGPDASVWFKNPPPAPPVQLSPAAVSHSAQGFIVQGQASGIGPTVNTRILQKAAARSRSPRRGPQPPKEPPPCFLLRRPVAPPEEQYNVLTARRSPSPR